MKLGPTRAVVVSIIGLISIGVGGVFWTGCQAAAGMFCQKQSDCRVGLVCTKSPGTANDTSYGVCVPARRGSGEPCQRSSDCESGLRCSIEAGIDNGDERHGICEPQPDGGAPDLAPTDGLTLPG